MRTDSKIALATHPASMCQEAFIVIVKKDLLEEESTAKVRTTKKNNQPKLYLIVDVKYDLGL